ncbi:MAG: TIGR02147 family protein [Myxococcales bacterium]|nr:TIGR02147 family protein [Myxococcales bacterium]
MSKRASIDVFRYLDYRAFLAEYYRIKKRRGFSYRAFSRRAGLASPNYLKLVIEAKRNLTPEMALTFAEACELHGEASEYFAQLVRFNQARDDETRNDAYHRLSGFRRYRRAQKLELAHAAYHATWYLPAIRELVSSSQFREDPAWIGRQLMPEVKPREVRAALDTLLELELLERDPEGHLLQTSAVVTTGAQTQSMHIGNYHREMMQRAAHSIELVPAAERDLTSVTFCIEPSQMPAFKERLTRFRRELLDLSDSAGPRARVMQLNLQLFPLTRTLDASGTTPEAAKSKENER